MKTFLTILIGCFVLNISNSQTTTDFTFAFDHQALSVKDVDASAKFYGEALGLTEMEDANKNPKIRWFRLRDGRQIHLIQADEKDISITKTIHLSFAVKPFDTFVNYLKVNKIPFYDWVGLPGKIAKRSDGIQQVYIQDPDGYWIEVNDVKRK
jgi:catechol 2,3-dioxygenase-like lactoylglutathione lyase family enzyme